MEKEHYLTPIGWIAIISVGALEAGSAIGVAAITGASVFQHYIDPHI